VWGNQTITVHRTLYKENYSWLNYAGMAGSNIIDRYRWEGGCIVQHVSVILKVSKWVMLIWMLHKWDRGEVWPSS